jgi:hypothetical protein
MCAHQGFNFWDFLIFDFGAIHAGLMCARQVRLTSKLIVIEVELLQVDTGAEIRHRAYIHASNNK